MANGFVSDVPDDDTVMQTPTVVVTVELSELPPGEALALIQEIGVDQCEVTSADLGRLVQGKDVTDGLGRATIHLPAEAGFRALASVGVVQVEDESSNEQVDLDQEASP